MKTELIQMTCDCCPVERNLDSIRGQGILLFLFI